MNRISWDDNLIKLNNVFSAFGKLDPSSIDFIKLTELAYSDIEINLFEVCISYFNEIETKYTVYFYPELSNLPLPTVKMYISNSEIMVKIIVKDENFSIDNKKLNDQKRFEILINYGVDINTVQWSNYKQLCEEFLSLVCI